MNWCILVRWPIRCVLGRFSSLHLRIQCAKNIAVVYCYFFENSVGMDQNNEEIAVIDSSPPMVPVAIPAFTKPKESHSHPSCLRPCFWLQHHQAASATLVGCSLVAVRLGWPVPGSWI